MTRALVLSVALLGAVGARAGGVGSIPTADPRLRVVVYDPAAVVSVPVKRGVVTLVVLAADEAITEVAAGLGADCTKPEAAWCIAAQPGGRTLFVKPKSAAGAPNNLAVVTDKRTHALRFVVLADSDPRPPVYRLVVEAPVPHLALPSPPALAAPAAPAASPPATAWPVMAPPAPAELIAGRLQARPEVRNTNYDLAPGTASEDIVPTLVFDDGRFTYFRFPGNREVPAVFQLLADGSEAVVNARMEDDLLVVDRVGRRLVLRSGAAVVEVWNEAFDLDGAPPRDGTTVPGIERVTRAPAGAAGAAPVAGERP
jgi:type IV secretion system protein VirB9